MKVRLTENRMMNERNDFFQRVSLATGAEKALVVGLAGGVVALLGLEGEKRPFTSHHREN